MLEIGKVELCLAALFGGVGPVKAQRELDERPHGGCGGAHVAQELFAVAAEELCVFFAAFFAQRAHGLYVLAQLRIGRGAQNAEPRKAQRQSGSRPVPADIAGARELAQRKRRISAARAVFFRDDRAFGGPLAQPVHPLRPVKRRVAHLREYLRSPDRFSRVVLRGLEGFKLPPEPQLGAGVALRLAVQREHRLGEPIIVALAHADAVGEPEEVLAGFLVALVEHALDAALLYRLGPVLLDDAEIRRELRRVAVLAQKALAEGVYGAYLRPGAQCALTAQPAVVGRGGKALGYRVLYAAAQLRGRCLCKGYDQKRVYIRVALYAAQQALCQNARLAASGRRRYEHGAPRFLYRGLLRSGGLKPRHLPRLLPVRSTPSSREGGALFSCSRRFRRRGSGRRRNNRSACRRFSADRRSRGRPRCCRP